MALACTYTQNYAIYCSYAICASEFNSISDERIKKYIEHLELGLDVILQLKPVSYNYKNKYRMGNKSKIGLIAQDVEKILPTIVYSSFGQIDNISIEFNKNNIQIDNNKVTLQLNTLDIKQGDKLEISDIDNNSIISNIRTVDIIEVTDHDFKFIDYKIDPNKNLYISGKHVDDFKTIDYQSLIPILIKSIQELTERINILESKLVI